VAKRRGARVIATVSTAAKAELARQSGADHVILYSQVEFAAEVLRLTDQAGVHAVYDSVGLTTFEQSLLSRANAVLGWVRDGALSLHIGRTYPLERAAQAHIDLESRATSGKLLLLPA
jgi:NADPH:quinone reductase